MNTQTQEERELIAMFDSYCKRVIRNKGINLKREKYKHGLPAELPDDNSADAVSEDHSSDQQFYEVPFSDGESAIVSDPVIYDAFMALTPEERAVLILKFWQKESDKMIADQLGVTPRTVRNIKRRGLEKFKASITKEE